MNKIDLTTVQDINEPNLTECPYCGCDEYFINYRYSGTGICRCRFDGKEADNTEMYSGIQNDVLGKFAYCLSCGKKIFRIKD